MLNDWSTGSETGLILLRIFSKIILIFLSVKYLIYISFIPDAVEAVDFVFELVSTSRIITPGTVVRGLEVVSFFSWLFPVRKFQGFHQELMLMTFLNDSLFWVVVGVGKSTVVTSSPLFSSLGLSVVMSDIGVETSCWVFWVESSWLLQSREPSSTQRLAII